MAIQAELIEITKKDVKALYVLFRYAPELLNKPEARESFEGLKEAYASFKGIEEDTCIKWLTEDDGVQKAIKHLIKKQHPLKMANLYKTYLEKSENNVQAFKAFNEFCKTYFTDNTESELLDLLQGIDVE